MAMKTLTKLAAAAAVMASGLGVATAAGAGAAEWTIQVRGYVPLICNVQLDGQPSADNSNGKKVHLGQLNELCNNGNGYTVYATTPAGVGGEFIVGNTHVPVSSSGVTKIDQSATAAAVKQQLAYQPDGGQTPSTIAFTIVAN
jgi:hypothetical protein